MYATLGPQWESFLNKVIHSWPYPYFNMSLKDNNKLAWLDSALPCTANDKGGDKHCMLLLQKCPALDVGNIRLTFWRNYAPFATSRGQNYWTQILTSLKNVYKPCTRTACVWCSQFQPANLHNYKTTGLSTSHWTNMKQSQAKLLAWQQFPISCFSDFQWPR